MMLEGTKKSMKDDLIFTPKVRWTGKLNENNNVMDIVPEWPINKKFKYDQNKMIKAIQHGMILLVKYKGDKDEYKLGHERTICFMNLGVNKNTKNELARGWHLDGYSVQEGKDVQKVWRLFKTENIIEMSFTGNFLRVPAAGYKMNDRVLTERTISKADFAVIRRNQDALIKAGKIEAEEETAITTKENYSVNHIEVKNSNSKLNLKDPWSNPLMDKKNPKLVKISILKTIFGNEHIAILGAIGTKNRTVKVFEEKKLIGTYTCIEAFTMDQAFRFKQVGAISEFDLFTFVKKL